MESDPSISDLSSEDVISRFLQDAASRRAGDELSLPIRTFISKWGARRRGYWYVQQINEDLDRFGLVTMPSYEVGYIDSTIRLIPIRKAAGPSVAESSVEPSDERSLQLSETILKVGSLKSAEGDLVSVRPEHSLDHAQSLMMQFDYSQLPVLSSPRDLLGALSWESIAQRRIHRASCVLKDCIVAADVVDAGDDLLYNVPRIISRGFVFVRGRDRQISGIVTTTDLSSTFLELAEPFLLIGQAERCLRKVVVDNFSQDEIAAAKDPRDELRAVETVESLTLGEIARLFEPTDRWQALGWQIDRKVFLTTLSNLLDMRNETMHFSPDPVEEEKLQAVRNSLKWLQMMV
jgi:CBS domain-containing protein